MMPAIAIEIIPMRISTFTLLRFRHLRGACTRRGVPSMASGLLCADSKQRLSRAIGSDRFICSTEDSFPMNSVIQKVEDRGLRKDLPEFRVGDGVRVHVKVIEGEKE